MYLLRAVVKPKHRSYLPKTLKQVQGDVYARLDKDADALYRSLQGNKGIMHLMLVNLVTGEISCYSSNQ
jgi:hypothetical protein